MATPYPPGTPWQQPPDPGYRGYLADAVGAAMLVVLILVWIGVSHV